MKSANSQLLDSYFLVIISTIHILIKTFSFYMSGVVHFVTNKEVWH